MVALKPDVILATGGRASVLAVNEATKSIPIAALGLIDPVGSGLARSLAKPGGNVTGLSDMQADAAPKRVELLKAVVPKLSRIAVLRHAADFEPAVLKSLQAAAQTVGVEAVVYEISSSSDIEPAFAQMQRQHVGGVLAAGTAMFALRREFAEMAIKYRMPAVSAVRAAAEAGTLMSYGVDLVDVERRLAGYVAKILKGAKPADMPIEQPTRFELVINLKTAKALGITIPQIEMLRADELIQ